MIMNKLDNTKFLPWAFQLRGESGRLNRALLFKVLIVCLVISALYSVLLLGIPQVAGSMPGSSNMIFWLTWVGPSNLIWNLITIIPLAIAFAAINSVLNIDIIEIARPWVDWVIQNPENVYVFWVGNLYIIGLLMITLPTLFWTFAIYSIIKFFSFRKQKRSQK